MKLASLTAVLLLSIGAVSCKKEDKPVIQQPTLSFVFDGKSQVASHVEAVYDTTDAGQVVLQVDGVMNNFTKHMGLTLTFPDKNVKAGSLTAATFTFMNATGDKGGFSSKTLQVNITNINNKYAEGTFSGVLSDGDIDKQLTDGTFKVNIQ